MSERAEAVVIGMGPGGEDVAGRLAEAGSGRGDRRLGRPGRVAVDDREIEVGRAIVVATGTKPFVPPITGLSDIPYWTNREAVVAKEVPSSLVVLGGGAIGLELGQVFSRFGSRVTIVEALDHLLPLDEPEAGGLLAGVFDNEGMVTSLGRVLSPIQPRHEGVGHGERRNIRGTHADAQSLACAEDVVTHDRGRFLGFRATGDDLHSPVDK